MMMSGNVLNRGILIAVEGGDRGGKSTQCLLLKEQLEKCNHSAEYIKFPERTTPIGQLIDQYLKKEVEMDDHAIHLLFSANRWELSTRIETLLQKGVHVILDRYAYSGVAYSSAKGMDPQWCRASDSGLPAPDLLLEVVLDGSERIERGGFGEERYEKAAFQEKVSLQFQRLAAIGSVGEDGSYSRWMRVDGNGSIAQVAERVWGIVDVFMGSFDASSPISTLQWL